jgi:DNA-directed RNA polymerase specialized sigma24 family protein
VSESNTPLKLDETTARRLTDVANKWDILLGQLNERERLIFNLHYMGLSASQIADMLEEDDLVTNRALNRLRKKIRSRAMSMIRGTELETALGEMGISPKTVPLHALDHSNKLNNLHELQRRVAMTAAKAAAWEDAVSEARR